MEILLDKFKLSIKLPEEGKLVDSTRYEKTDYANHILFAYLLPDAVLTGTRGKMEIIDDIRELVDFNLKQIILKGFHPNLIRKASDRQNYYVFVDCGKSKVLQSYFYYKNYFYSISATVNASKKINLNKIKKLDIYNALKNIVESIKNN